MTWTGVSERSTYRGYGLLITDRTISVFSPEGVRVGMCGSMRRARRLVRLNRKAVGR